jgi:hypothetical protein
VAGVAAGEVVGVEALGVAVAGVAAASASVVSAVSAVSVVFGCGRAAVVAGSGRASAFGSKAVASRITASPGPAPGVTGSGAPVYQAGGLRRIWSLKPSHSPRAPQIARKATTQRRAGGRLVRSPWPQTIAPRDAAKARGAAFRAHRDALSRPEDWTFRSS